MAASNRERVGRAFELLAGGLRAYVERQMSSRAPGGEAWFEEWRARERGDVSLDDPAFLLKVITDGWDLAFRSELARSDRSLAFELRDVRNRWAHNESFNADDTYRALDSVERLLTAVQAPQAAEAGRSKSDLMRLRYEAETRKAAAVASGGGAVGGLRPWREVIAPHEDVAQGRFALSEFAANLQQVSAGQGRPEYCDPVEFFRRTYLTEGLRQLLVEAVRRVSATGGVPVVDLQTTFGGGKTHSLIALWHLFCGLPASDLPQEIADVIAEAGVAELPAVRRCTLVGNWLRPAEISTKPDGTKVATMWGELAWQLGGAEGYELVAGADGFGTNPGGALEDLFRMCAPCLILIDEWVAYARLLYGTDKQLPAGTFDAHVSFAQTLTEAARAVDGTLLVVSLPASLPSPTGSLDAPGSAGSTAELGGPGGAEALRRLRSVMGRMESSWRPASAEEGFEIVRRRLFKPIEPDRLADRDVTARAFADLYRTQSSEFPSECKEPAYERRIKAAYPIHPELFDRLYDDWSTLEGFQRTRGVLRLMAMVVGSLWRSPDQSPLILPGSVPLDDTTVVSELHRNLDDSWTAVMDDVDGPTSLPASLDQNFDNLGRYQATCKVARSVFLGSAPTVHSPNRGIEASRVRLGCASPRETVATYSDALARLSDRATYLYADRDRYWYGLSPSVSRLARERAERWLNSGVAELDAAICDHIRAATSRLRDKLAGVHVAPDSSSSVDDEDRVRLVILPPSEAHMPRAADSPALVAASDLLHNRGSSPRLYRNMIIFLACDQRRVDDLRQAMAEALAWDSVAREAEAGELDLGAQQAAQAARKRAEAFGDPRTPGTVDQRLGEAYTFALVPIQPEATGPITFEAVRVEGQGGLAERTSRRLVDKGYLNVVYAPSLLRTIALDRSLASMWKEGHVSFDDLWEAFARYPYLPRLTDREVLARSVERGPLGIPLDTDGFGLAQGYDESAGRYAGLVVGAQGSISISGATLLVRPEVALAQLAADEKRAAVGVAPLANGVDVRPAVAGSTSGAAPPAAAESVGVRQPRRFHGSVVLGTDRLNREFGRVVDEVVTRLGETGEAKIQVSVEVSAISQSGFDEATIRTVSENARTLRFTDQGFEEE